MTTYKISTILTADDVVKLFNGGGIPREKIIIEEVRTTQETLQSDAGLARQVRPRKPRGSKVETTIRDALAKGAQTSKELRTALEGANLKGGSLGVGLANLQKSGEVVRSIDGSYTLTVAFPKAAE